MLDGEAIRVNRVQDAIKAPGKDGSKKGLTKYEGTFII